MQIQILEELNCPICISLFKIPITTSCGHSFCRSCLINSTKNKKVCPICRQQFQNSPQKLKQDDTLSAILKDISMYSARPNKFSGKSFQYKSQPMLLLDIKTKHLLIPYNTISATFELQSPTLLNKSQKLVARQEYPYNKYGVISRIVSVSKLRHNVYQCALEGKAFCLIEDDTIEQGTSDADEQYFYRTCKAKQIIQTSSVNLKQFQDFLTLLKKIKNPQIQHKIYKQVNYNVFFQANDPLALTYSIFGLIDVPDKQKYLVLTEFNDQKRINLIKSLVQNVKHDVSINTAGFIKIRKEAGFNYLTIALLAFIVLIIYIVNKKEVKEL